VDGAAASVTAWPQSAGSLVTLPGGIDVVAEAR